MATAPLTPSIQLPLETGIMMFSNYLNVTEERKRFGLFQEDVHVGKSEWKIRGGRGSRLTQVHMEDRHSTGACVHVRITSMPLLIACFAILSAMGP